MGHRAKQNKYADQAAESREKHKRERVCESKVAFDSEDAARRTGNSAYACQYCRKWHTSSKFNRLVSQVTRIQKLKARRK